MTRPMVSSQMSFSDFISFTAQYLRHTCITYEIITTTMSCMSFYYRILLYSNRWTVISSL